ncbi:TraR/DksA C4-type zinc finger protein [Microbacterium sp. C7(2022)]|nr:TraR/DksA C4-type zinc finger protein [Microbacterium sp. C7(2022)]
MPDLHALRAAAEHRRDALTAEIARLRVDRSADSADDEHDPEGVPLSSEWSRLEGLLASVDDELREIDEALRRWHDGTYGICVTCGQPIPPGRLEARPTAIRCVACAS